MSDPITYNSAPEAPQPIAAAEPPKKSRSGLVRIIVIVVVLLAAGGYTAFRYFSGDITVKTPKVGECVTAAASDKDVENVKIVDCSAANAADKVVGVLNGQKFSSFNASENPCTSFPTAESAIFYGKEDSGFVLCLVPAK